MSESIKTDWEKLLQICKDICEFFIAIIKHQLWWLGVTISGGVMTLWAAWPTKENQGGRMIPFHVLFLFLSAGLVVASFLAFRDQKRIKESKIEELKNRDIEILNLKLEIDELVDARQTEEEKAIENSGVLGMIADFRSEIKNRIEVINKMSAQDYFKSKVNCVDEETEKLISKIHTYLRSICMENEAIDFTDLSDMPEPIIPQLGRTIYDNAWIIARHELGFREKKLARIAAMLNERNQRK